MTSSDNHIAVARDVEAEPQLGRDRPGDTLRSPPPPSPTSPDDTDRHDTIPTPAPEAATTDGEGGDHAVVIPPLGGLPLDGVGTDLDANANEPN